MKKNEKMLTVLNQCLVDELTAINQYRVHSEMCNNWGYEKLHKSIEKREMDEIRHAEWLIERILSLEGVPSISKLNSVKIGKTVLEVITNDKDAEMIRLLTYNSALKLANEIADIDSVDLLTKILRMEENHVGFAESKSAKIEQMGLENYLVNQDDCVVN